MWPCRGEVWPDLAATRQNYAAVAHAIRQFEPVTMAIRPQDVSTARSLLGSDVDLFEVPLDDSWARDAGPCFLTGPDGAPGAVSFRFNAWGAKYRPWDSDDAFADAVIAECGARAFASDLVAEGGGVSVDGEGTILTTETCFPNRNRNPDWTREEIEAELIEMLGGRKVIWLPGNELETETDGHVDGIAVFAAPGIVLAEKLVPEDGDWYRIAEENLTALEGVTDASGRSIRVVHLPGAEAADIADDMFCRSYVNSYIVNGGVVMPKYGEAADDEVREIFEDLLPGRRVAQVPIPHIGGGGGGIHCITQQEPAIS